jgi:7-cyano-7-deazaguanine synthase in queuosine biosynthesis
MNRLVVCDGVGIPRRLRAFDPEPLRIDSTTAGTLNIRIPSLSRQFGAIAPDAAVDLLRIAAFAYWADQMVTRPVNVDVSGEDWKRTLVMLVAVQEPDLWNQPEVDRALRSVLGYGTDDEWIFHFERAGPQPRPNFLFGVDAGQVGDPSCVLLFSGGTDSFCAAVTEAAQGRRPMLVSHSPSPSAKGRQARLQTALLAAPFDWRFPHYPVDVSKRGIPERERTQRSRGFLYSSIGAAVAAGFGLRDVVLADNGFVSVGLPLNGQTVGAKMSRTTHPRFQYLFNKLCKLILPGIAVRNPLLFQTRAEALESLKLYGLENGIRETSSCAAGGRLPASESHCGVCSQCLDRKIGVIGAGLEYCDQKYKTDIFLGELTDNALMLAESYVRLMRKLSSLSAEKLIEEYVELTDCAYNDVDGEPAAVERIVAMLQRQAETVNAALTKVSATVQAQLLNGEFPNTCMVRLALARHPDRKRRDWRVPGAPDFTLTAADEKEFEAKNFRSRMPIIITGEVTDRASNKLEVGGQLIMLQDADFILLLRLIVGLCEEWRSRDGYCPKGDNRKPGGVASEEGVVPGGIEQAIGRLRKGLQPALADLDPKDLIEVSRGSVRLSTHPRLIEIRRDALAKHRNQVVRHLLARIPAIGFVRP